MKQHEIVISFCENQTDYTSLKAFECFNTEHCVSVHCNSENVAWILIGKGIQNRMGTGINELLSIQNCSQIFILF